ncbi:hypothetical protein D3C75_867370 [compost metagenome]
MLWLLTFHHLRDHRHIVAFLECHSRRGQINVHLVHLVFGKLCQIVTHGILLLLCNGNSAQKVIYRAALGKLLKPTYPYDLQTLGVESLQKTG